MKNLLISYTAIVAFIVISLVSALFITDNTEPFVALQTNEVTTVTPSPTKVPSRVIYFCRMTRANLNEEPLKVCNELVGGYLGFDKWKPGYQLKIAKSVNLQNPVGTNPVDTTCSVVQWDVYDQVFVKYSADANNYCHYEADNNHCSFDGVRRPFDKTGLAMLKQQFDQKCVPATATPKPTNTPTPTATATPTPTNTPTPTATATPTPTNTPTPTATPTDTPKKCVQTKSKTYFNREILVANSITRLSLDGRNSLPIGVKLVGETTYNVNTKDLTGMLTNYPIYVKSKWGWRGDDVVTYYQTNEEHKLTYKSGGKDVALSTKCLDLGNATGYKDGQTPLLSVEKADPIESSQYFQNCAVSWRKISGQVIPVIRPMGVKIEQNKIVNNQMVVTAKHMTTPAQFDKCVKDNNGNKNVCGGSHYSLIQVEYCVAEK